MREWRTFTVGVFESQREGLKANGEPYKVRLEAYTTWYSPEWKGCCVHEVLALSGATAKVNAMEKHRACMAAREPGKGGHADEGGSR